MKKLLNDQLLNLDGYNQQEQQVDVLLSNKEVTKDLEGEIEKGNLQDYLEIFGDLEDI